MQIQEIINHIAAGESVAAKESIENVLSAKAFDALQGRKQEMAATLFGGQEQSHEEVTDDEEEMSEGVVGRAVRGVGRAAGTAVGIAAGTAGAIHGAGKAVKTVYKKSRDDSESHVASTFN